MQNDSILKNKYSKFYYKFICFILNNRAILIRVDVLCLCVANVDATGRGYECIFQIYKRSYSY